MDATDNVKVEKQTTDLENVKIEFETTKRLLAEKEKVLKKVHSDYHPFLRRIEELKQSRDRLNEQNRKIRKDIKDTEDHLRYLHWQLSQKENEASTVRAEIESVKKKTKPFELPYQQAQSEYLKLQKHFDELNRQIKEAEVRLHPYSLSRVWSIVFPVVILILVLVVLPILILFFKLPWYVTIIIFVCALLAVLVFSAVQLRHEGKLSEENFVKLVVETIKQIPELLKGIAKK